MFFEPNRYDAAIFDMDGTLLDTMLYWRYTSLEFLLAHGIPFTQEDLLAMHDCSSRKLVFEVAGRAGVDIGPFSAVVGELETYMNRHYLTDARLKEPAVPKFLSTLRDAGLRMCVATGSPRQYARNGLRRLGLIDYFDFVTDSYEFRMSKTDPEIFRIVAERLGTAPERCIVFEDAPYAVESAKKAGCAVVAIEDETAHTGKARIMELADWYIRSYEELMS